MSLLRGPFSLDLLEAAPAFVHCSELGGSILRGTDPLALVRNDQCLTVCPLYRIVPIYESSFRDVPLCLGLVQRALL